MGRYRFSGRTLHRGSIIIFQQSLGGSDLRNGTAQASAPDTFVAPALFLLVASMVFVAHENYLGLAAK